MKIVERIIEMTFRSVLSVDDFILLMPCSSQCSEVEQIKLHQFLSRKAFDWMPQQVVEKGIRAKCTSEAILE